MAPKSPKTTQNGSRTATKWRPGEDGEDEILGGFKEDFGELMGKGVNPWLLNSPKTAQNCPKMAKKCPKMAPEQTQDVLKMAAAP